MRYATLATLFTALVLASVGCSGKPDLRPEPAEVKVTVKLPGSASGKDLALMLQPQQNTQPALGKLGADGSFTVKLAPGKYIPVFEESNAKHPAYASIPASYRSPSADNAIEVNGQPVTITVK